MATRNKVVFKGTFERVYDQAHNRIRLISRGTGVTAPLSAGHIERTLFRAKEPQGQLTAQDVEFSNYRMDDSRIYMPPEEAAE